MAQKHMVVCQRCGRQFDANKGASYDRQSRRYTCKRCLKEMAGNTREKATGMRQSTGAMIAKIVVGVMFLVVSITREMEISARCIGVVIAAGLIAWALVPYFRAKKAREAEAVRSVEAEAARLAVKRKCPACGAMTQGDVCEFCGTALK